MLGVVENGVAGKRSSGWWRSSVDSKPNRGAAPSDGFRGHRNNLTLAAGIIRAGPAPDCGETNLATRLKDDKRAVLLLNTRKQHPRCSAAGCRAAPMAEVLTHRGRNSSGFSVRRSIA
jgi:hypothetical protein